MNIENAKDAWGWAADWHLKFPFFSSTLSLSQIKSNLFNSSVNNSLGWQSGRGVLVLLPLWAAKNTETLSHINIANLFANGFQKALNNWLRDIVCSGVPRNWILYWKILRLNVGGIPKRPDRALWDAFFSLLRSAQINSHHNVATSHDCHTWTSRLMLQCAHVLNCKTTRVRPFLIKRPVVGAPFVAPFWDDVLPCAHADLLKLTDWIHAAIIPTKTRGLCQQSSVSSALISMLMWAAAATGPCAHVEVISSWTRVDRAGWCIWS